MAYAVAREGLIGFEPYAVYFSVFLDDSYCRVAIYALIFFAPIEFVGVELLFAKVCGFDVVVKAPKFLFAIIYGFVAFYLSIDIVVFVKAFETKALGEIPIGTVGFFIDIPFGGDDSITNYARVGYDGCDRVGVYLCSGFYVDDRRCHFVFGLARSE